MLDRLSVDHLLEYLSQHQGRPVLIDYKALLIDNAIFYGGANAGAAGASRITYGIDTYPVSDTGCESSASSDAGRNKPGHVQPHSPYSQPTTPTVNLSSTGMPSAQHQGAFTTPGTAATTQPPDQRPASVPAPHPEDHDVELAPSRQNPKPTPQPDTATTQPQTSADRRELAEQARRALVEATPPEVPLRPCDPVPRLPNTLQPPPPPADPKLPTPVPTSKPANTTTSSSNLPPAVKPSTGATGPHGSSQAEPCAMEAGEEAGEALHAQGTRHCMRR